MSNSRDLLKEAIADAKSVKEAAIANAKAALEEAFTPYLQEKFAAKLEEMDREEDDDAYEGMTDENYGEDDKMEERLGTINDPSEEGIGNAYSRYQHGNLEEKDLDELDLEELLAELDDEERTEGMEEKTEESLTEAEEEEETEEEESEEEVEGEDEEIDLEDMSEEDLKALIEDVIADMVAAGELEAGENFEEESDEEEIDIDDEETEETEEEIMEGKETKMDEGMMDKLNKVIQRMKANAAAGRPLIDDEMFSFVDKADLLPPGLVSKGMEKSGSGKTSSIGETEVEEMKDQIEELASTLSEVKLLNAKLLYTNKIFRAKNLTENQKVKVLEAFDKAASVKEAKLIYETLTTIKETKSPVTESMRGMASKAAGMAPEKKPILEVNDQFARWQILAGIKKNN
jgi:hypothetical protein